MPRFGAKLQSLAINLLMHIRLTTGPEAGRTIVRSLSGICIADYALCLCFAPKHPDIAPAKKERFCLAMPRFGAKLQSLAINLLMHIRLKNGLRRLQDKRINRSRKRVGCVSTSITLYRNRRRDMPPTADWHAGYKQILREYPAGLAAVGGELGVARSAGFACGYAVNTDGAIDALMRLFQICSTVRGIRGDIVL